MSQTRYENRTGSYRRRTGAAASDNRGVYVYGNTVRKLDIQEPERRQKHQVQQVHPQVRKNREKARHMSMGYVLFLAAAMVVSGFILVNYIQLQADLTNTTKQNARLESNLSDLRIANDEAYNRVMRSVDLEEVKRIAIGELGMVNAGEGQIYNYTNEGNDYMRRATENEK